MERRSGSAIGIIASVVIVVAALRLGQAVLIPFALAVLLSFLLGPLVMRIERLGVGRVPAVVAVVLLVASLLGGIGWGVGGQLSSLVAELPAYRSNLVAKVRSLRGPLGGVGQTAADLEELEEDLTREAGDRPAAAPKVEVVPPRPGLVATVRDTLRPVLGPLGTAGLVVVFTVFMLLQREDLRDRLIRLSGGADLSLTTQAMDDAARRVSRFLLRTTLLNAMHGVVIGTGLYLIGLPAALVWGLLSMLLRFVPYVGPWVAAAAPIALAAAVFDGWNSTLLTAGLFVTVELLSNNVLEPWIYGRATGLSPFGVIVAAVFWAWLWGPVGLLLAIPLTVCLVVLGRYVPRLEFLAIALGDEPVLEPAQRLYQRLLADDAEEVADILEQHAESGASALELRDALALPALAHLARDRAREAIEPERADRMRESLAELVDDASFALAPPAAAPGGGAAATGPHPSQLEVLCVPARDEDDALAARWLAELLAERGFHTSVVSPGTLASELVDLATSRAVDAVCLSAMSPRALLHLRYLRKRLHAQWPDLPVLIGLWDDPAGAARARARSSGEDDVRWATTFAEAIGELAGTVESLCLRKEARNGRDGGAALAPAGA